MHNTFRYCYCKVLPIKEIYRSKCSVCIQIWSNIWQLYKSISDIYKVCKANTNPRTIKGRYDIYYYYYIWNTRFTENVHMYLHPHSLVSACLSGCYLSIWRRCEWIIRSLVSFNRFHFCICFLLVWRHLVKHPGFLCFSSTQMISFRSALLLTK